jgi:aminoglycoside phosphotransferase (APT) family kinase protein
MAGMAGMTDLGALTDLRPLAGGWSGRTFLGEAAGEQVVVRIFPPDQPLQAPEVQAAVLTLVRGLLPVPRVLEVRRADPDADVPGLLVTELLPGERGDLVLPGLDDEALATVAARVGRLVAALGGMPMLRTGLFDDADLRIVGFALAGDLPAWVEENAPRFTGWTAAEVDRLREVAHRAQALLDAETRSCLVHSDLNPKNLLVDPDTLEVTGLVDWEFAHAGHPATDLGNALRFERRPAWERALLDEYVALRGGDPAYLRDRARAADLWALVDLATRAGRNPVADAADGLLRRIAATGDLHADPRP